MFDVLALRMLHPTVGGNSNLQDDILNRIYNNLIINPMKKTIFLSFLIVISLYTFSQDVITLNSGEKIRCKITSVDSTNIYFTMVKNGYEINTLTSRSSIKEIKYGVDHYANPNQPDDFTDFKNSITIGFLEGGGSLIGMDLELLLSDRFGIQAGAGFVGFGGGINIHFKPSIRSSFISLQYWHQGFKDSYTQSLIGPNFVFRAKKLLTAQLGLGFLLESGPAWPEDVESTPIMLTYAIGLYFPW